MGKVIYKVIWVIEQVYMYEHNDLNNGTKRSENFNKYSK